MLIFAAVLLSLNFFLQAQGDLIIAGKDIGLVEIESGKIRGYIDGGTFTFKGIPYAYAERFMPPEKAKPWTDVRFMGYYGATCPLDFEPIKARGNGLSMFALRNDWGYPDEDCQSLNIWTPGIDDDIKRPVLIWIHGGGYEYGSSHELPYYDGKNLSRKGDIVFVSVNHRLNILGFLDLSQYGERYKYTPNLGLIDLVTALQWVKRNISNFGGDPNNITLFGQSGGGGKITALLNSPVAAGLFQKAIIQSGSFTTEYQDPMVARRVAARVLEILGIDSSDVDQIRTVRYDNLLQAGKKAIAAIQQEAHEKGEQIPRLGWGPVNDNYFLPYQMFGPEVMELCKDIPVIIGTTKTEFSAGMSSETGEDMEATRKVIEERYKDKAGAYMEAVLKAYPNTFKASDFLDIDFRFRSGALRDANELVKGGNKNVYMYIFTWESPVDDGSMKAMHCMELPFVFNNIILGREITGGGEDARKLADIVSRSWINFAWTGNPDAEGLPKWPRYSIEKGATMIINSKSEVRYHPDSDLLQIVFPGMSLDK